MLARARRAAHSPARSFGTSPRRYSFAATRLRFPTTSRAISGSNTSLCGQFTFGSPDYPVTNPRFFLPAFISPSSAAETNTPNTITIEGLSIKINNVWHTVPTSLPVTITPDVSTLAGCGVLLDAIPVTIPANTLVTGRVAYNVPAAGSLPTNTRHNTLESIQGSTSTMIAFLTNGTTLNNTNAHSDLYFPSFMIAQGGDGRPAFCLVGDSIGAGANEHTIPGNWSSRLEFGFIGRGLDDNATAKRLPSANLCVPGDRPFGSAGWDVRTNWQGKLNAVKLVRAAYGYWPFDYVISEHGTNSLPAANYATFKTGMIGYYGTIAAEWGKPIVQSEMLQKPGSSSDGYQTLGNQVPTAGTDDYPNGQRWLWNADLGTNGVADPTTLFRTNGCVVDTFAPWTQTAYDLSTNRDKLALRTSTTLAASYVSGSTISLTASPALGEALIFISSGVVKFDCVVTAVSGSGPYTVTFTTTSATAALNNGDIAQAAYHAKDGLHPGTIAHRDYYAAEVVNWKKRRGWA